MQMKAKKSISKNSAMKPTNSKMLIELNDVLKAIDPSSSRHRTNLSRFNFKIGELNSEKLTNYGSKIKRSG